MLKLKAFIIIGVVLMCRLSEAQMNGMVFDTRMAYDIYFSTGSDSSSVVKNVMIVRTEEISGKVFLVIRDQGFKLKLEEGFILLDAVVAILPERNFRVHQNQKISIQQ